MSKLRLDLDALRVESFGPGDPVPSDPTPLEPIPVTNDRSCLLSCPRLC
jgi:hypothetical protein